MPSFDTEDTIAAIASPPGGGWRGIIRISGPMTQQVLANLFCSDDSTKLKQVTRTTRLSGSLKFEDQASLPGELLVWPTRRSYTGQPAAEFHTFGSPPLLKLALARICESGARLARPGEFTLRAFLSGRLDLVQAEAVLAIIDAQEREQLDGALKQLAGGLSGPLSEARDQLKWVLAELEAGLDFVEEDIEFISREDLISRLHAVETTLMRIVDQIGSRGHETELIRVALIGLPNAGKSSLFNAIQESRQVRHGGPDRGLHALPNQPQHGQPQSHSRRFQRAIVTDVAGTTTDFLSAPLEIEGLRVQLIDTAGNEEIDFNDELSSSPAEITRQAQDQRQRIESQSQIQVLCIDGTRPLSAWETERLATLPPNSILVETKSDSSPEPTFEGTWRQRWNAAGQYVRTSSLDLTGIPELIELIYRLATDLDDSSSEVVSTTVLRAADSLRAALQSAQQALSAASEEAGEEIVAAEIRSALDELGQVVGTVYTDDILDLVFGRFCIGK